MTTEILRAEYLDCVSRAERLRDAVVVQLAELLRSNHVTLGVPIESRVKAWDSISEKLDRKQVSITSISQLQDLIGVRAILLFRSDLLRVLPVIRQNFDVISAEDTSSRLKESEFGYQSQHFVVRIPKGWLSLPTLAALDEFYIELQIRTLAQHIWAAASHKLQYKQEAGVPLPLRRTINRVSALLETVDLEFDRVLEERQAYVEQPPSALTGAEPLNVDNLVALLGELFPPESRLDEGEDSADLLSNLNQLGIQTPQRLREVISKQMESVRQQEAERVAEYSTGSNAPYFSEQIRERISRGIFYSHVGLARAALRAEFGDAKVDALFQRPKPKRKTSVRRRVGSQETPSK